MSERTHAERGPEAIRGLLADCPLPPLHLICTYRGVPSRYCSASDQRHSPGAGSILSVVPLIVLRVRRHRADLATRRPSRLPEPRQVLARPSFRAPAVLRWWVV